MSCCVQAMARDVCSICTNAKLIYAREWQEAPTPHSPVYPRSALNDVLFKSEPLQAKYITNRRLIDVNERSPARPVSAQAQPCCVVGSTVTAPLRRSRRIADIAHGCCARLRMASGSPETCAPSATTSKIGTEASSASGGTNTGSSTRC